MLDLYLIRHAESEMNLNQHLIGGRSNQTPLSALGNVQALWLGRRLEEQKVLFDQVYCSTAVRTRQTAKIVCELINYPLEDIVYSERILELDEGDWEGQPREQIYTAPILAEINSNNWNFTPPNGESQREVEERMYSWIEENLLAQPRERLIAGVFTHGLAIKCLLRGILESKPGMTYKIELENTSITRLKYDQNGWHLRTVNDTGHLNLPKK